MLAISLLVSSAFPTAHCLLRRDRGNSQSRRRRRHGSRAVPESSKSSRCAIPLQPYPPPRLLEATSGFHTHTHTVLISPIGSREHFASLSMCGRPCLSFSDHKCNRPACIILRWFLTSCLLQYLSPSLVSSANTLWLGPTDSESKSVSVGSSPSTRILKGITVPAGLNWELLYCWFCFLFSLQHYLLHISVKMTVHAKLGFSRFY